MKGAIRIGSGHNFGMPSGMNKIMDTATVQRQGIFQFLALPVGFATIRACVSVTIHTPYFAELNHMILTIYT